MARENYRERAVVVHSYDFAEADRIVVLLTRGHGLVRGVAKGVRRSKSRFGSRVQLFVELDVLLYPGRALANITAADTVSYFGAGIIEDYPRYTTACAALEAAVSLRRPAHHPPPHPTAPRPHPGTGRFLTASHGPRWLGTQPVQLRAVRQTRPASRFPPRGWGSGVHGMPSAGIRHSAPGGAAGDVVVGAQPVAGCGRRAGGVDKRG